MFGITTTRRLRAEVAAAKAETDRQRQRAKTAEGHAATAVYNRKQALHQLAEAHATITQLTGRNDELRRRSTTDPGISPEEARKAIEAWEQRLKDHAAWEPSCESEPLIEGGLPRPTHPAVILRRVLDRCQALEARLAAAEGRKRVAS